MREHAGEEKNHEEVGDKQFFSNFPCSRFCTPLFNRPPDVWKRFLSTKLSFVRFLILLAFAKKICITPRSQMWFIIGKQKPFALHNHKQTKGKKSFVEHRKRKKNKTLYTWQPLSKAITVCRSSFSSSPVALPPSAAAFTCARRLLACTDFVFRTLPCRSCFPAHSGS